MNPEESKAARESIEQLLSHVKSANKALVDKDLNSVAWYLNLAEKHAHALKQMLEDDPE